VTNKIINSIGTIAIVSGLFVFAKESIFQIRHIEDRSEKSNKIEVGAPSPEACKKLLGASRTFLEEVARDLDIPYDDIVVRGGIFKTDQYGYPSCFVYVVSKNSEYSCKAISIATDDRGQTYYAQGHGYGLKNGYCRKL
jgi:hypothetical protein